MIAIQMEWKKVQIEWTAVIMEMNAIKMDGMRSIWNERRLKCHKMLPGWDELQLRENKYWRYAMKKLGM